VAGTPAKPPPTTPQRAGSTTAAWFSLWATGSVFIGAVQRTAGDAAANAAGEFSITQLDVDADADITA
jgi:hypothetical protein